MANGKLVMEKKGVVREHEKLVDVLKAGSPEARQEEAREQSAELSRYRRTPGRKVPRKTGR